MADISPTGTIWILHNVPLDKTYQNTMYWPHTAAGRSAQVNWFLGSANNFVVTIKSNQYYTRHTRGSIRVNILADFILDCNYLVFRNPGVNGGEGKTFFAFITSVEYINNNVAQVNYAIDVIQTWYFEFNLVSCFVERTHAISDAWYSNITPEPVTPGEYTYTYIMPSSWTLPLYVVIAVVDVEEGSTQGNTVSNVYSGCTLYAFQPDDIAGINARISQYIISPDSIVAIYMVPQCLILAPVPRTTDPEDPFLGTKLTPSWIRTGIRQLAATDLPDPSTLTNFGGYTPHNKKLYSYHFTQLEVFTPTGVSASYRYEFFQNHVPAFAYGGTITQPVELTLVPLFYKIWEYDPLTEPPLFNECVTINGYPQCSWNTDAYKAWCAQNTIAFESGIISTAVHAGVDVLRGHPFSAATGVFDSAVKGVNDLYTASIAADKLSGTAKGSSAVGMNVLTFYFAHKVINEDNARRIDSFFDRFGYAVNKVQVPQQCTRTYYTYLKTSGCSIHGTTYGSVPADDEELICRIHDQGVTYWNGSNATPAYVGDFSVAEQNLPLGGGG